MSAFIDLDMTLTDERSIIAVGRRIGLDGWIENVLSSDFPEELKSRKIASALKGIKLEEIACAASETRSSPCARETIYELSNKGFDVNIVTLSYKQVAEAVLEKLGLNSKVKIHAPELETRSGIVTGEVKFNGKKFETPWCIRCPLCKRERVLSVRKRPIIAIGDSVPDVCMFLEADFSILIDRGNAPWNLKHYATLKVRDLCEALESLKSYLTGMNHHDFI